MREFLIEASELHLRRWREPIDRAEKDASAAGIELNGNGRMRLRLDRIFDGGNDDRVVDDGDNDAARGEVGDNFLGRRSGDFLSANHVGPDYEGRGQSETEQKKARGVGATAGRPGRPTMAHISTVSQVIAGAPKLQERTLSYHSRGCFE